MTVERGVRSSCIDVVQATVFRLDADDGGCNRAVELVEHLSRLHLLVQDERIPDLGHARAQVGICCDDGRVANDVHLGIGCLAEHVIVGGGQDWSDAGDLGLGGIHLAVAVHDRDTARDDVLEPDVISPNRQGNDLCCT